MAILIIEQITVHIVLKTKKNVNILKEKVMSDVRNKNYSILFMVFSWYSKHVIEKNRQIFLLHCMDYAFGIHD